MFLQQYDRVLICEITADNNYEITDTATFEELLSGATMFLQLAMDRALLGKKAGPLSNIRQL